MNTLSIFNPQFSSDLFDLFDESVHATYPTARTNRIPPVDIIETKDNFLLEMELCGLSENDIDLNVKDRVLTIGTKKAEKNANPAEKPAEENIQGGNPEEKKYLLRERKVISFTRKFTLPQNVDVENVSAKFINGLLTVQVPKKPESELKRIQINVA
ncbi:MAG: Hsp20/alpha crystallin family protein [Spirochaetaceae bacterium]|nr:Hsp20/alpha crystallin family protein [Spirochaetaceae bacterium]